MAKSKQPRHMTKAMKYRNMNRITMGRLLEIPNWYMITRKARIKAFRMEKEKRKLMYYWNIRKRMSAKKFFHRVDVKKLGFPDDFRNEMRGLYLGYKKMTPVHLRSHEE